MSTMVPTRDQFDAKLLVCSNQIQAERLRINKIISQMPVSYTAIYADGWTSNVGHKGFIEISQSFVINGKRGRQSLGIYEFNMITQSNWVQWKKDYEELEAIRTGRNYDPDMNIQLSQISINSNASNNSNNNNSNSMEDQSEEEIEDIEEEIEEMVDEAPVILRGESLDEIQDDKFTSAEEERDGKRIHDAEVEQSGFAAGSSVWMDSLTDEFCEEKQLTKFEFIDKFGQQQRILISRESSQQLALAIRKMLERIKYCNHGAEGALVFKNKFVSDSGIVYYIYI